MADSLPGDSTPATPSFPQRLFRKIGEVHQTYLDKSTPHPIARWVIWSVLLCLYFIRVYILQGYYLITYALGIFVLNLFIGFLTPRQDPALSRFEDSEEDDGPSLPTKANEEFRPFMRRLPEFKFWYSALKAVIIATVCTFFDALNVPVFWPILVMYFILLFTITMKRQIKHMIKYRYLPFSHGKTKYKGKEDTGKVASS